SRGACLVNHSSSADKTGCVYVYTKQCSAWSTPLFRRNYCFTPPLSPPFWTGGSLIQYSNYTCAKMRKMDMQPTYTIGDYLLDRLVDCG
ncbi:indolepyruvate decarboxylase, partial [Acinetobacter baumannii]|nr:indolepyruvate decarboxylase [Acinetobacter baumannii]